MTYFLQGYDHKHGVEELLIHLFPTESHTRLFENGEAAAVFSAYTCEEGCHSVYTRLRLGDKMAESHTPFVPVEGKEKTLVARTARVSLYALCMKLGVKPSVWGAMTGVRPVKLATGFVHGGMTFGEAMETLKDTFFATPQRIKLVEDCARVSLSLESGLAEGEVSLYVSIPFCPSRCHYCSFISSNVKGMAHLVAPYLETLHKEITETATLLKEKGLKIITLYMGGGTPTTLSPEQLDSLLAHLAATLDLSHVREYTVEAGRVDTISPEKLQVLKKHGVQRISINPQSLNDEVLQLAGRPHTAQAVLDCYAYAKDLGFDSVNMDVIAGLEGESFESFCQGLDRLITLAPENITVHTLAVKKGANITDKSDMGASSEDTQRMVDYARERLYAAGYTAYYLYKQKFMAGPLENVGYTKAGHACLYNVYMMEELQTIISVGAGAVTKLVGARGEKIKRISNPKYPYEYKNEDVLARKDAIRKAMHI